MRREEGSTCSRLLPEGYRIGRSSGGRGPRRLLVWFSRRLSMTMLISVGCWRVIAITRARSNWDPSPLRGATVLTSALLHDGVASQRKGYIDIPPGHSTLE